MCGLILSYIKEEDVNLDSAFLHEQAPRRRHGPLLSPARALEGVAEGALPQHRFHQDLKQSQPQDDVQTATRGAFQVMTS